MNIRDIIETLEKVENKDKILHVDMTEIGDYKPVDTIRIDLFSGIVHLTVED